MDAHGNQVTPEDQNVLRHLQLPFVLDMIVVRGVFKMDVDGGLKFELV